MTVEASEYVPGQPERRRGPRRKFRASLEIEWGSTVLKGTVRDISPEGLFVELVPPLWVGAMFRARLILVPAVSLNCRVARVEPETGVAVVFEVPEESGKAQIDALLVSLSPA
jgi:hypothetical protein